MTYTSILAKINTGDFRDEIIEALDIREDNIGDKVAEVLYRGTNSGEAKMIDKWLSKEVYIDADLLNDIIGRFETEYLKEVDKEMQAMLELNNEIRRANREIRNSMGYES